MLAEEWKENFRMGKDNFYKLCGELRRFIERKITNMRLPVSVETLFGLAFGLSRACVSVIIRRVTRAITVHLGPNYIKLPDCETNFINRFSTLQCLGAIDGTRCNKTASRKLTLTGKVTIRLKYKLAPTTGTASRTL